jgi:purine-binding chemotaxis protein CheW
MSTKVQPESRHENAQRVTTSNEESKYLTFKLAEEEYGVEILKVREIIGVMDITSVPQMPVHMKGVINLRGKVIPVIDLRLKFGFQEIEHTEQTCIIVVDVGREIGIIVDTVSEVLDIASGNIEPPPSIGGALDTSFILGMGKVGEAVKILLDIDRVLTNDKLVDVPSSAAVSSTEQPETVEAGEPVNMPAF